MDYTYEEVLELLRDGEDVYCSTPEEVRLATNAMLGIGFEHGYSDYSKRYADGDFHEGEEFYNILTFYQNRIEYRRRYGEDGRNSCGLCFENLERVGLVEYQTDDEPLDSSCLEISQFLQ